MKLGDWIWTLIILLISSMLFIPATNAVFMTVTKEHPYLLGFIKFAVMATMGELLVSRILYKRWAMDAAVWMKAAVWGIVGLLVVLMFGIFSNGVTGAAAANLLPAYANTASIPAQILKAFLISLIMNVTFGPAFMAAHRVSDRMIENAVAGRKADLVTAVSEINWIHFMTFVVGKTLPFFWIPAHTIAFLLPSEYRIIVAAYLSIVLGIILTYAKRGQAKPAAAAKEV